MTTNLRDQSVHLLTTDKSAETRSSSRQSDKWDFEFEDDEINFLNLDHAPLRRHCVLVYDDEEEGGSNNEMRWELKEGVPICLGRSSGIGSKDKMLSRRQVECLVDFEAMVVVVTRVGRRPSMDQEFKSIPAGATVEMGHLDTFWLLENKYPIHVFIEKEGQGKGSIHPDDDDDQEEDDDDDMASESEESGICSGIDEDNDDDQLLL